jgi:hypothetical protein
MEHSQASSETKQKARSIVLDANIIFDLEKAEILGQIFRLDCQFITIDMIFTDELKSVNSTFLKKLGLKIVSITGSQTAEIYRLRSIYPGPSKNDLAAFIYARDNRFDLATRDSALWQVADDHSVVVLETPEIIQNMVDEEIISRENAAKSLEIILKGLPVKRLHWQDQIKAWRK